jgi:hypothetical protein
MISTEMNPMKKVREIEKLRKQYGDNIPVEYLLSSNGYTVITSGYYQFNYWWQEIINCWKAMKEGSIAHSLWFVPYMDLPEAFLNKELIAECMQNDPKHVFQTEWCADWIADSEGAFPMSLLEASRDPNLVPKPCRDPVKDKGKEFIFGIDYARERDASAIVVIELGYPCKVVYIAELEETPIQDQARHVFDLVEKFNPVRIQLDAGGGGRDLRDLLADPSSVGYSSHLKLVELDAGALHSGKRVLNLCDFNSAFIEDMNNNTKTLLEQGALKLPASTHPIEKVRKKAMKGGKKEIDLVQELLNQTASVVITPTATGRLKYDLPKKLGSAGGTQLSSLNLRRKDLYTAFVLGGMAAYEMAFKPMEDKSMVQSGVIKEIKPQAVTSPTMAQMPPRYTISNKEHLKVLEQSDKNRTIIPAGGIIISRNGK